MLQFLTFALLKGGVKGGGYKGEENKGSQSLSDWSSQCPAALELASGVLLDDGVPHHQDSALPLLM